MDEHSSMHIWAKAGDTQGACTKFVNKDKNKNISKKKNLQQKKSFELKVSFNSLALK